MKKYLLMLVFVMMLAMPMMVSAANKVIIEDEVAKEGTDGKWYTRTAVYLDVEEGATKTVTKSEGLMGTLTEVGEGVDDITVEDSENFVLTYNETTKTVDFELAASKGASYDMTGKVLLGYITTHYDQGVDKADCGYKITIGDASGTHDPDPENPETGVSLPIIVLGGALVVGLGALVLTKNKTKMYKI